MPEVPSSAVGVAWDLSDLFAGPDDPRIRQALDAAQAEAERLADAYRGKVNVPGGPDPALLLTAIQRFEAWSDAVNRIAAYAGLLYAADTTPQANRDLEQYVEQRLTELQNLVLFFDLEWRALPDEAAEKVMASPALTTYRHYLTRERLFKSHTLSEPEEKVVNDKDLTGSQAWQRLFTEQLSGMTYTIERDGEQQELTQSALLALYYQPDRALRRQAHDVFYDAMAKKGDVLTFIYETLVQDKLTMDRLRKYADPMAGRHLANEVDPEAVEQMMRVTVEHYPIAHEYFALKGKLLNIEPLVIYDQYAPLGGEVARVTYDEGRELVLEALGAASDRLRDMAAQFFERRWIDADPRRGKRGGAFCMGVSPNLHPYVLCNYTDTARDVMTVAHELGHGMHDLLAGGQTMFNYYPVLPLAETASVFSEMLTFDLLAQRETDPRRKLALVAGKVEEIFATVFRQNVLTQFERSAFEARKEGRFTPEAVGDLWIAANQPYYGEAVQLTPGYRWGWSYIPHFINTPFYCYAYVFGELLVLALYAMYRDEGPSFIPRYLDMLAAGGSETPATVLQRLGVDIRDPNFWRRGFAELRRMVDWVGELAALPSGLE
jgi:oligoendopeptidase F